MYKELYKESQKIANLIILQHEGKINQPQSKELKEWINSSIANERIYNECISESFFDIAFKESYCEPEKHELIWKQIKHRAIIRSKRIKLFKTFAAAASIILILGMSVFIFVTDFSFIKQEAEFDFKPGKSEAILKLANGQKLSISSDTSFSILSSVGNEIKSTGKELSYKSLVVQKEVYNELIVPKGAEHSIQLSDGTKIHLNAQSELKYPEVFIGNKRLVFLKGEAYFEVTHNSEKPFYVNVNGVTTKVLGTEFSVRSYEGENKIVTTLVKGKIEVFNQSNSSFLNPGQQSIAVDAYSDIKVNEVDVSKYIGWHKGRIVYDDAPLDRILQDLSRWYNFELFYDNASVKSIPFSCDLERYQNLSTILTILKKTNKVKFKVYENSLVVETI